MDITNLFCQKVTVVLAKQGEYGMDFSVDYSTWVEEFGSGSIGWSIQRSADPAAYLLPSTEENNISTIVFSEAETQYAGRGLLEVFYVNDGESEKRISNTLTFMIEPSLQNTENAPEAWESYIDAVHADATEVKEAAETIINLQADGTIGTNTGDLSVVVTKTIDGTDLTLHFAFDGLVPDLEYDPSTGIATFSYGGSNK